jgi:hypothetical protein
MNIKNIIDFKFKVQIKNQIQPKFNDVLKKNQITIDLTILLFHQGLEERVVVRALKKLTTN